MISRPDTGAHYRHSLRVAITQADIERGYVEVKLDPYRICSLYETGGGPREHIAKKALRGTRKGGTPRQLVHEIRDAADRWEELLDEEDALTAAINAPRPAMPQPPGMQPADEDEEDAS